MAHGHTRRQADWVLERHKLTVKFLRILQGKSHVMAFTTFSSLMIFSSLTSKRATLPKSTFQFPVIAFIPVTFFLLVIFDKNDFWIIDAYLAVYLESYRFVKTTLKLNVCLRRHDWHSAFHKHATRSTSCCNNLQSGGSRVLPSLAVLAWDQIAVWLAFFEDETKRIEINTGQAEDERSQAKDEKAR